MNDGLKQRIVGALVLLALGIIFLPVIFDRERIVPVDRKTHIPPEPAHEVFKLPQAPVAPRPKAKEISGPIDGRFDVAEKAAELADSSSVNEKSVNETTESSVTSRNEIPAEKKTENFSLKSSWALQVASFETKKRAMEVLKQLEVKRYRGFVREVDTSQGSRTRLFVGPSVDKGTLEKAKQDIDASLKVESMIVRFKSE